MRVVLLSFVIACGGQTPPAAAPMPAATPPPSAAAPTTDPEPVTVAVNDPKPAPAPSLSGDPCEGGEVTGGKPIELDEGKMGGGGPPKPGYGVGHGGGNVCGGLGGRKVGHGPRVRIDNATATDGGLDKAIIRRYIKRNLNKIEYCYEKELLAKPGIAGRVNAKFKIGQTGLVVESTATGLPVVADCVAAVIKEIEFPKPAKVTEVNYPFNFNESAD